MPINPKTRMYGGVTDKTDKKGTLYTVVLFVHSDDLTTHTPTGAGKGPDSKGQTATSFNTQSGATYVPVASSDPDLDNYIYEYERRPIADHYIITILACNADYDWGESSGSAPESEVSKINRSWGTADLFLQASWWGIIPWEQHAEYTADNAAKIKKYNDSGLANGRQDLVFANAKSSSTLGSANFDYDPNMPFSNASLTYMPLAYVNRKVPVISYVVNFLVANTKPISYYVQWSGVSGSIPSSLEPETGTITGAWRSVPGGRVREKAKRIGSIWYNEVERHMWRSPGDLRWDPARNGGTWTWS